MMNLMTFIFLATVNRSFHLLIISNTFPYQSIKDSHPIVSHFVASNTFPLNGHSSVSNLSQFTQYDSKAYKSIDSSASSICSFGIFLFAISLFLKSFVQGLCQECPCSSSVSRDENSSRVQNSTHQLFRAPCP